MNVEALTALSRLPGTRSEPVPLGPVPGLLLHPPEGPAADSSGPGVILFPHRDGLDGFIAAVAARLGRAGLPVLAVDLFAGLPASLTPDQRKRQVTDGSVLEASARARDVLLERYADTGPDGAHRPAPAAFGFCMGGRLAFLAAAAVPGLSRACSFYGGELNVGWGDATSPIERVGPDSAPVQLHRGSRDSNATAPVQQAAIEAYDAAGRYAEAHTYACARHAFANPADPTRYNPEVTATALAAADRFLTRRPAPARPGGPGSTDGTAGEQR